MRLDAGEGPILPMPRSRYLGPVDAGGVAGRDLVELEGELLLCEVSGDGDVEHVGHGVTLGEADEIATGVLLVTGGSVPIPVVIHKLALAYLALRRGAATTPAAKVVGHG